MPSPPLWHSTRGQKVKPTKQLFLSFFSESGEQRERERREGYSITAAAAPLDLIYSNTDTRGKDNGEKKEWAGSVAQHSAEGAWASR